MLKSLSNIQPRNLECFSTGFPVFDHQVCSQGRGGLPRGKISMVTGEAGVGKSRWAVTIAKSVAEQGWPVAYFTMELPPDEFASEKMKNVDLRQLPHFHVGSVEGLAEMLSDMRECNPSLVVVDSVNALPEFAGGRGARALVEGDGNSPGLRGVAEQCGSHVMLLNQVNADGNAKGGTSLMHWVDIEMKVNSIMLQRLRPGFGVTIPQKNRCGMTGYQTVWEHKDYGVRFDGEYPLGDLTERAYGKRELQRQQKAGELTAEDKRQIDDILRQQGYDPPGDEAGQAPADTPKRPWLVRLMGGR